VPQKTRLHVREECAHTYIAFFQPFQTQTMLLNKQFASEKYHLSLLRLFSDLQLVHDVVLKFIYLLLGFCFAQFYIVDRPVLEKKLNNFVVEAFVCFD